MKISIVTPTYNSSKFLRETIDSVLTQRGPFRIQYIVIDGGSSDNTVEIIREYADKIKAGDYDGYNLGVDFNYISESDSGMYDALAKGFRLVDGDFCAYINSDDFYLPNCFKTIISVFAYYTTINWLTGVVNVYNEFGANFKRILPFQYNADWIRKGVYGKELNHIQQESVFFRTDLLKQINLKSFSDLKYSGDYYLWHEFAKKNKLWIVNSIISGFRTHSGNKSADLVSYNKEFEQIVSEKKSLLDRVRIYKHKLLWRASDLIKQKYSKGIISVIRPVLMKNFAEINECLTGDNEQNKITSSANGKVAVGLNQKISVVIGSYNRLPLLKLCINAIRDELHDLEYELIVVDGGSTDGAVEWLSSQKDIITILQHNRGEWHGRVIEKRSWGYFMNLGFKAAEGKYVCMLSDDALIIPGAIVNGYNLFEEKLSEGAKLGSVAFYFRDYPIRKKYAVAVNLGSLYVNHGIYLKKALSDVGYISEDEYHFYFADTDLVLKIKEKGYECIASPTSFVEHYFEATPEIRKSNNDNKKEQDRLHLINKWSGRAYEIKEKEYYTKIVGYWDYHPVGYEDKFKTIDKLIDVCHD